MDDPDNRFPSSSVSISMLISESVYRLVVAVERAYRWFMKAVFRPARLLLWCLIW